MLRRIPSTPLVCLSIFLSIVLASASWATGPDESLEILLKPGQTAPAPTPAAHKVKGSKSVFSKTVNLSPPGVCAPLPMGISKVKPATFPSYPVGMPPCILPAPGPGQWEIGAQAIFARLRGKVQWPRYPQQYYGWWAWGDDWLAADFTDELKLPSYKTLVQFNASYHFRPNWAVRYSVIPFELNGGGGDWSNVSNWFVFGNILVTSGQPVQSKWQHAYHRLGIVYDPVRTCTSKVSIFADWVHIDDRIDVNCSVCGWWQQTFSKGTDAAMVGLEIQRCVKTLANGSTFSCDYKAGAMFLDDVEGWDVELGGRYTIPLNNAGRWGYVKGGYRLVDFKKSQSDYLLKYAIEGGFMEFGFIF